jgi:hypothetical protein
MRGEEDERRIRGEEDERRRRMRGGGEGMTDLRISNIDIVSPLEEEPDFI